MTNIGYKMAKAAKRRKGPYIPGAYEDTVGSSEEFEVSFSRPARNYKMHTAPFFVQRIDGELSVVDGREFYSNAALVLESGGKTLVVGTEDSNGRYLSRILNEKFGELGSPRTRQGDMAHKASFIPLVRSFDAVRSHVHDRVIPDDLKAWLESPEAINGRHDFGTSIRIIPVQITRTDYGEFRVTPSGTARVVSREMAAAPDAALL